jgi:hypothetical protein
MPRGIWLWMFLAAACGEVKGDLPVDAAPIDTADTSLRVANVTAPPSGVEIEGGTGSIAASLVGPPGTQITVMFGGNLGAYAPATLSVTTDTNGMASAASIFTANAAAGTESGTAIITMPTGAAPYDFSFPVVPFTKYGNTSALAQQGQLGAGNLLGHTIVTNVSGRLRKLGLISGAAGVAVKIGLYTDVGGQPGNLIAQIPSTNVVAGVNEFALPSPVVLPAGTYWFMAIYSPDGSTLRSATTTRVVKYIAQPFANALPTTYPATHMMYTGPDLNYYLVVGR